MILITLVFAQASMAHTPFFTTVVCVIDVEQRCQRLGLCTGVVWYVQGVCVIGQARSNSTESWRFLLQEAVQPNLAGSPCWRPRGESLDGCGAARLYTNTTTCPRPHCSPHLSVVNWTAIRRKKKMSLLGENLTTTRIPRQKVLGVASRGTWNNITVFMPLSRLVAV